MTNKYVIFIQFTWRVTWWLKNNLKTEVEKLQSLFTQAYKNFQKSDMGDPTNEDYTDGSERDKLKHVFSNNFYDLCPTDLCLLYRYCYYFKFGLLYAAQMLMTNSYKNDSASASKFATPRSSKTRDAVDKLGKVTSTPIKYNLTDEKQSTIRMKRQRFQSQAYSKLDQEYVDLYVAMNDPVITPFL